MTANRLDRSALVALVLGASVATGSTAAFVTVQSQHHRAFDRSLEAEARLLRDTTGSDPTSLVLRQPASTTSGWTAIVYPDGSIVDSRAQSDARLVVGDAEVAVALGRAPTSVRTVDLGTDAFRVFALPVRGDRRGAAAFVYGRSTRGLEASDRGALEGAVVGGLLGLALAGIGVARMRGRSRDLSASRSGP